MLTLAKWRRDNAEGQYQFRSYPEDGRRVRVSALEIYGATLSTRTPTATLATFKPASEPSPSSAGWAMVLEKQTLSRGFSFSLLGSGRGAWGPIECFPGVFV